MGWSVGIRLHIARHQLHSIPESLEDGIVCVFVCLWGLECYVDDESKPKGIFMLGLYVK